jgi:hypothetical protein
MDGVFREAVKYEPTVQPDNAPKSPPPILAKSTDDRGLYVYETLAGHPYTAKHFDMMPHWESPTSEMQDKIKSVDEWVQSKARERNLADSSASYDEIIDGVLKQIGKSKNESKQATFERISNAIEAYKRLEMAKLPPVLDVKSMTPDEYKKTRA